VEARAFQRQVVVGDGDTLVTDLLDQCEQGVVGGQQVGQRHVRELLHRQAKELLGGVIGEAEPVRGVQQQHRYRQRAQHHARIVCSRRAADHLQQPPRNCRPWQTRHAASMAGLWSLASISGS
jgi:hypothetical protein